MHLCFSWCFSAVKNRLLNRVQRCVPLPFIHVYIYIHRMHIGWEDIASAYVTLSKSGMDFAHIDGKNVWWNINRINKKKGRQTTQSHSWPLGELQPISKAGLASALQYFFCRLHFMFAVLFCIPDFQKAPSRMYANVMIKKVFVLFSLQTNFLTSRHSR